MTTTQGSIFRDLETFYWGLFGDLPELLFKVFVFFLFSGLIYNTFFKKNPSKMKNVQCSGSWRNAGLVSLESGWLAPACSSMWTFPEWISPPGWLPRMLESLQSTVLVAGRSLTLPPVDLFPLTAEILVAVPWSPFLGHRCPTSSLSPSTDRWWVRKWWPMPAALGLAVMALSPCRHPRKQPSASATSIEQSCMGKWSLWKK